MAPSSGTSCPTIWQILAPLLLFGQKFTIHTDHVALVWLKNVKELKGCFCRCSFLLSMYKYDIKYTKVTTKIKADVLSRDCIGNNNNECVETNVGNHVSHLLQLDEIQEAKRK